MSDHISLIVDDEPAVRTYLRAILEREQIHCLEAENAIEALRIVKSLDGRLDLIVTDVKMPGDMDGIDLAHAIGANYPAISVILITGYADEKAIRSAASVFKLIQKPFAVDTVLNMVRQSMTRPELQQKTGNARERGGSHDPEGVNSGESDR